MHAAASPAPPAYAGMGSKQMESSQNGATVLTLWYERLRGETGLTPSMPWLNLGKIGVRR